MGQNRSTWLEKIFWKPCPYWRDHGDFCLKGRLQSVQKSDFCTRRTLKYRCNYADVETLTEEQAQELDQKRFDAWEKAYDGMAADGYMVDPESPWLREAVAELGVKEVAETFRIDSTHLEKIERERKEV